MASDSNNVSSGRVIAVIALQNVLRLYTTKANYTVVLIQIEHNFFLRTKVNSLDEMEKAACFGWLLFSNADKG